VLHCVAVCYSLLQCIHIPSPEITAVSVSLRSRPRVISHSESEPELPKFYSESDAEWSFIPKIVFCLRRSPNGVLSMASATGSGATGSAYLNIYIHIHMYIYILSHLMVSTKRWQAAAHTRAAGCNSSLSTPFGLLRGLKTIFSTKLHPESDSELDSDLNYSTSGHSGSDSGCELTRV